MPHAPENLPAFPRRPSHALNPPVDSVSLEPGRYKSHIAITDADWDAACRLRFLVFHAELGEGIIESCLTARDHDRFDPICEHLIIEDTELSVIAGTYRMQSGHTAFANFGYDSRQQLHPCLRAPEFRSIAAPQYTLPVVPRDSPPPHQNTRATRTYIGTGARICVEPAWARPFGTIDFLTLLGLEH